MTRRITDVKVWLASRDLLLNDAKTEAILFTTPTHRAPRSCLLPINIYGRNVITSANLRQLGVHLDSTLLMIAHVSGTERTEFS